MEKVQRCVMTAAMVAFGVAGSAQEPVEYQYRGETFMVLAAEGEACCVEVRYKDRVGYLGVPQDATPRMPYRFTLEADNATPEKIGMGVAQSVSADTSIEDAFVRNLNALCSLMLRVHLAAERDKAFDRKAAEDALHEGVRALSRAAEQ